LILNCGFRIDELLIYVKNSGLAIEGYKLLLREKTWHKII
jgi:hypothetical protein